MTFLIPESTYERLAEYYEARFKEPLVADFEWCSSFLEAAYIACDMQDEHDLDGEAVARAAIAIAVLTHGENILDREWERK